LRILVVDDEADARELLVAMLESCSAAVTTAANVVDALHALDFGHFDPLVSDIGMPGEDGHSLIRQVRERSARAGGTLPAIALTAYARLEDRTQALRAGFNLHVAKPIDPSELVISIAQLARVAAGRG
jgi:CheY-like chemotaxis protein